LRSEERWRARALLALIVVLTLGLVFLQVLFNDWNRQFFEALQNKDFASFGPLLVRFGILAGLYIVGAGALALSIENLSGPVRRPVVGSKYSIT